MSYKRKLKSTHNTPTALAGRLYSPDEAAAYLGIAAQTLAHWRVRSTGPKFIHLSKRCVRYSELALKEWVESRTQESTAENR